MKLYRQIIELSALQLKIYYTIKTTFEAFLQAKTVLAFMTFRLICIINFKLMRIILQGIQSINSEVCVLIRKLKLCKKSKPNIFICK